MCNGANQRNNIIFATFAFQPDEIRRIFKETMAKKQGQADFARLDLASANNSDDESEEEGNPEGQADQPGAGPSTAAGSRTPTSKRAPPQDSPTDETGSQTARPSTKRFKPRQLDFDDPPPAVE